MKGGMKGMHYGTRAMMGAGKIKPKSGTPLAGNTAGSNVMLRKNTAGSTPTQKAPDRNLGASMIRVPNRLRSGRGR